MASLVFEARYGSERGRLTEEVMQVNNAEWCPAIGERVVVWDERAEEEKTGRVVDVSSFYRVYKGEVQYGQPSDFRRVTIEWVGGEDK